MRILRLSPAGRAVVRLVGHRGAALLFFALVDAAYALSLVHPSLASRHSASMAFVAGVAPLWFWGLLWAFAAGTCATGAIYKRDDRWGFAAAMCIKVLWGVMFAYGAIIGVDHAWLAAIVWLCMAGWVQIIASWPEPRTEHP